MQGDRPSHESLLQRQPRMSSGGKLQMSLEGFSPEIQNVFRAARGKGGREPEQPRAEGPGSVDAVRDMLMRQGKSAGGNPVQAALASLREDQDPDAGLESDPRAREFMVALQQLETMPLRLPPVHLFGPPAHMGDDGSRAKFVLYVLRDDVNCDRLAAFIRDRCPSIQEHMWRQDVATLRTRPSWLTGVPALFYRSGKESRAFLGKDAQTFVKSVIDEERAQAEPARQAAVRARREEIAAVQQRFEAYKRHRRETSTEDFSPALISSRAEVAGTFVNFGAGDPFASGEGATTAISDADIVRFVQQTGGRAAPVSSVSRAQSRMAR